MPHKYTAERIREVLQRMAKAKATLSHVKAEAYGDAAQMGEPHWTALHESQEAAADELKEYEMARVEVAVMLYEINGTLDLEVDKL